MPNQKFENIAFFQAALTTRSLFGDDPPSMTTAGQKIVQKIRCVLVENGQDYRFDKQRLTECDGLIKECQWNKQGHARAGGAGICRVLEEREKSVREVHR